MVVGSNEKTHFKLQSSTKARHVIDIMFNRLEKELGHQLYSKEQAIIITTGTSLYILFQNV